MRSVFQVAEITRPLMSVSKICDQGLLAVFDMHKAVIKNAKGETVCEFARQGGLYVTEMVLRKPNAEGNNGPSLPFVKSLPFGRQGS